MLQLHGAVYLTQMEPHGLTANTKVLIVAQNKRFLSPVFVAKDRNAIYTKSAGLKICKLST